MLADTNRDRAYDLLYVLARPAAGAKEGPLSRGDPAAYADEPLNTPENHSEQTGGGP